MRWWFLALFQPWILLAVINIWRKAICGEKRFKVASYPLNRISKPKRFIWKFFLPLVALHVCMKKAHWNFSPACTVFVKELLCVQNGPVWWGNFPAKRFGVSAGQIDIGCAESLSKSPRWPFFDINSRTAEQEETVQKTYPLALSNGQRVSLTDGLEAKQKKGNVVVSANFWSTICAMCRHSPTSQVLKKLPQAPFTFTVLRHEK